MSHPPQLTVIAQPFGQAALGTSLAAELASGAWTSMCGVVAFLKSSGLRHLAAPLHAYLGGGGTAEISVGIDHDGTSLEALQDLWRVVNGRGELYVFKEGQGGQLRTFHPKGFLFKNDDRAVAIVGSGNLTGGGLFTNHELGVRIALDRGDADSSAFLAELEEAFDKWQAPGPACIAVDAQLLLDLVAAGDLLSEAAIAAGARAARTAPRRRSTWPTAGRPQRFGSSGATGVAPAAPDLPPMGPAAVEPPSASAPSTTPPSTTPATAPTTSAPAAPSTSAPSGHRAFLIEVRPHHNGEIFLSRTAINDDPGFFGWPFSGWTIPKKRGNPPYPMVVPDPKVEIAVYDASGRSIVRQDHSLNVVYYEPKSEIRITIPPEPLARIPALSLLVMTRNPTASYDYWLEFYPPSSRGTAVTRYRSKLTHTLPSGGAAIARRYGWS